MLNVTLASKRVTMPTSDSKIQKTSAGSGYFYVDD